MIGEEKVHDSSDSDYESQEVDKSQSNSNDAFENEKNVNAAESYGISACLYCLCVC